MRIGVFAYNFPHWKSSIGLFNLYMARYEPIVVYCQNWHKLEIRRSRLRVHPEWIHVHEPAAVAHRLGIRVVVCDDHSSPEVVDDVRRQRLDVGVILGARILGPAVIDAFRIGVINAHPGLIPENRGLDNLKWAIVQQIRQGVTTHLIDERIDMGRIIARSVLNVVVSDTLIDVAVKLAGLQQAMIINSIAMLETGFEPVQVRDAGTYHGAVPDDVDREIPAMFAAYKARYNGLYPDPTTDSGLMTYPWGETR